ncbi:MAG: hypothetical protein P4L71_12725 [Acetobacteraceae bacterium]|nr:hypothetical protein [Acetobacteraceae bacterium]
MSVLDAHVLRVPRSGARRPLVCGWELSSFSSLGVYGLNLALSLANHPDYALLTAQPIRHEAVVLDPLGQRALLPMTAASQALWNVMGAAPDREIALDAPVLLALGQEFSAAPVVHGRWPEGDPTIGMVFLERAGLSPVARQRAARLALIVAASSWNESVLRADGLTAVTTVLQGIDTSLFHPAPRAGRFPGRFVVFSGGDLDFRTGQDLVLAAFRIFRQRHPQALLLAAWPSSRAGFASTFDGTALAPMAIRPDGVPDVVAWAVANGIPPDAVITLEATPDIAMPHVLREVDVAVFPNRCEGGTNPVAMGCLACGIPTILSDNTGHRDLLVHDIAVRLHRQSAVRRAGVDTLDWGESDVEEIVEQLEAAWRDRSAAAAVGARAAAFMPQMDWRIQVGRLLRAIEPLLQ